VTNTKPHNIAKRDVDLAPSKRQGVFHAVLKTVCTKSRSLEAGLSLRRKTLAAVSIALSSLIGVIYATTFTILTEGYAAIEDQTVRQNVERTLQVYTKQLEELKQKNRDWAALDDTYAFVQRPTLNYLRDNLSDGNFLASSTSIVLFLNASGKLVYGKNFDPIAAALPESLLVYLQSHPRLMEHAAGDRCHAETALLPQGAMLLTACPIVTSQTEGPIRGTLLMGRLVNETLEAQLAQITQLEIHLYPLERSRPLTPQRSRIQYALSPQNPVIVEPQSEQIISGYTLMKDLLGQPTLLVQVNVPRTVYQQGKGSLLYLIVALGLVGAVFGAMIYWLTDKLVLFWRGRQENEARYRAVIAQASEGIVLVDADTQTFLEVNAAFTELLGYSMQDLQGLQLANVIGSSVDATALAENPSASFSTADPARSPALQAIDRLTGEQQYRHKDDRLIDVEVTANLIRYAGRSAFCIVVRDITERKRAEAALRENEQQLAWQASHDPLTGLVNRREFERRVQQAIQLQAQAAEDPLHALCFLDLDRFKIVNDTCGHAAGDELLRQLTGLLRSQVRASDVLARLGGDEFGLLLHYCPLAQAVELAESLRQSVQNFRFLWQGQSFAIGVSIGLVNLEGVSLEAAFSAADAACYTAKHQGRNRVHLYQETDRQIVQRHGELEWAARLRQAMSDDRLRLYCQPIVATGAANLSDRPSESECYEVLVRLQAEDGSLVTPQAFLPAAERYHLMQEIDRWVIHTLFASQSQHYQQSWQRSQAEEFNCLYFINLSSASLNDSQFVEFLQTQFHLHQIPPQVICFEITEATALTNLSRVVPFVRQFREFGCHFALDDFGSSLSAFTYLKNLPVDFLKIDGAFIRDLLEDPAHFAMTETIHRIAQLMELQTIAESVESDRILDRLREMGVDYAQGYGIAKPRPLVS
jgi:diguanylate cyclase (GGDEF)-like protein